MSNDIPMLFKFTRSDGRPPQQMNHDGKKWSLPTKNPDGTWTPGDVWDTGATEAIHCTPTALHATDVDDIRRWFSDGARLFQIEFLDTPTKAQGKWAGTKARLLREIEITPELLDWLRQQGTEREREWQKSTAMRKAGEAIDGVWYVRIVRQALLARLEASKADIRPETYERLKAATEAFTPEAFEEWLSANPRRIENYRYVAHTPFWQDFQAIWKESQKQERAITAYLRAYYRAQKEVGEALMPKLSVDMDELRKRGERLARKFTSGIAYDSYVDISYSGLYRDESVKDLVKEFGEARKAAEEAAGEQWEKDNPLPEGTFDPRVALGMVKAKRGR